MSAARADRLVELLAERELDSLLVTNLLNVRYLTGFTGTNGAAVVTPDERLFFTDFRYVEQARGQVSDFERIEGSRDMLDDLAQRLRCRTGFDDADVSVASTFCAIGTVVAFSVTSLRTTMQRLPRLVMLWICASIRPMSFRPRLRASKTVSS